MNKTLSGSTAVMDFGEVVYGDNKSLTRDFTYSCLETGKTASVSSSNSSEFEVSLNKTNIDCSGTVTVTVKFKPNGYGTDGKKSSTITVSSNNGASSVSFTAKGTCKRATPTFTGSAYTLNVDGTQTANYAFTNTSATTPTASSSDNFYYTIDNVVFTNESQNKGTNFVTYNPSTKLITACNGGTGKITFHQKQTDQYAAASKSFDITVNKYSQSLSWTTIEENMLLGGTQTIAATASSGLTPTYSSGTTSVISVSGNTLSADAEGYSVITASQAGNYKYNAATSITKTVNVCNKEVPEFTPSFSGTTCALLVDGTATITLANVSDGLNGDFTAVPADGTVVSVTRNGNTLTVTGLKQGSTTVTLHQKENDGIFATNPDPVYTFNVSRVTNTLAVAATSKAMKVDEAWTPVVTSKNSTATIETTSSNSTVATYNTATNTITAHNEGSTTIIIKQAQNVKYTAASCTISVTVTKYDNTLALAATSYSKKVDDTWSCAVSSINSDAAMTVTTNTSTDSLTATYNSSTKAIDFNVRNAGSYTVTLNQPATYKYTGTTKTISVNVTKHTNTLSLTMDGAAVTTKSVYYGAGIALAFSSSNGSYAGEGDAFRVEQTAGSDRATYYRTDGSHGVVYAGTKTTTTPAKWTVYQPADYKYEATAKIEFSVSIVKVNESCDLLSQTNNEYLLRDNNTARDYVIDLPETGSAGTLSFSTKKEVVSLPFVGEIGTDKKVRAYQYVNGIWEGLYEGEGITPTSSYSTTTYTLSPNASKVKFESEIGTYHGISKDYSLSSYINYVSVTRLTYLNSSDSSLIFSPSNPDERSKTFKLSYSSCDNAGDLHLVSTNPKFSVSPSEITLTGATNGTENITITCAEAATVLDSGFVIAYDKAKTCSIKVKVSIPEPKLTWNPYNNAYFVGSVIPDVCVSENEDYVNCPLTYSSNNSDVAFVRNDTLFILNKKETVTITVSQTGKEGEFLATSKDFTFTPVDMPSLAVPFFVNSTITEGAQKNGGTISWDSNKVSCYSGNNYDNTEKTFYFTFSGKPATLQFSYYNEKDAVYSISGLGMGGNSDPMWTVKCKTISGKWFEIWHNKVNTTSALTETVELGDTVSCIMFCYKGTRHGYFKDIKVTGYYGDYYLLDGNTGGYLSRGKTWCTRAIVDEFGIPVRFVSSTDDNANYYHHLQFYDNRLYLFEDNNNEIYTDKAEGSMWIMHEQSDGTYFIKSANNKGKNGYSITIDSNNNLALTEQQADAIRWTLERCDRHPARMMALKDAQVQEAAVKTSDLSDDVTWTTANAAIAGFDLIDVSVPAVEATEQKGRNYPDNNNKCEPYSYEYTVNNLDTGLYRLTLEACYQPTKTDYAEANRAVTGHENVLAYMFANNQKTQIKSVYDDGASAPASKSAAVTAFNDGLFRNYIYVYVEDDGSGKGSVHYGLHKPSWVGIPSSGNNVPDVNYDILWYRNFTLEKVTRKEFVFDGSGEGSEDEKSDWHNNANWEDGSLPNGTHWVSIEHDAVISEPVSVYGIRIEGENTLHITPTGGLTVGAGGIIGATAGNLKLHAKTTDPEKGKTGFVRINPACKSDMPYASVELFSIGYFDAETNADNSAAWQYVGSPVTPATAETAENTYYGAWVYKWNEATGEWSSIGNSGKLQPFQGYCTTQMSSEDGKLFTYEGQLTSNQTDVVLPLSYHTGHDDVADNGFNLLANSFAAPIDLTQFRESDFSGEVQHTIYLYNTGSASDWLALQEAGSLYDTDIHSSDAPGQYVAIPVGNAGILAGMIAADADIPAVIPAMQGFRVNATGAGASLRLNYNRLVWAGNYVTYPNRPLRAPKAVMREEQGEDEEPADRHIDNILALQLSVAGITDKVYLFEGKGYSAAFDNGADATKLDGGRFNIFATEAVQTGNGLAVCATDDLSAARIGVRTGEYGTYTVTCTYAACVDSFALRDLVTGEVTALTQGASYTFTAVPDSRTAERFAIERYDAPEVSNNENNSGVTTGVDNTRAEAGRAYVYTPEGRLMRVLPSFNADAAGLRGKGLPAGVYVVHTAYGICKVVVK